jgi:type I restriction enzyme, S subunit
MRDGWETVRLGDVLERKTDTLGSATEPTILTCSENHGLVDQLVHLGRRAATENVSKYKRVEPLDIVYNVYLLWLGAIGQNLTGALGITSPVYEVFRPSSRVHPPYMGHLLRSPGMVERYSSIAIGTVPRRRRTLGRTFWPW